MASMAWSGTHHAQCPEDKVVQEKPSLLGEAYFCLWLFNPCHLRYWIENISHNASAQSGEDNNPVSHEVEVVGTLSVLTGGGIVVRELKEHPGALTGPWKAYMCEAKQE